MRLDEIVATTTVAASRARQARLEHERKVRKEKKAKEKKAKEQESKPTVNEISLKTKAKAYSRAMDPDFDYYADGTHNPKRKMGQADRLRAAIAKKHGEEAANQADDQAAYDHYGDYMFKDRKIPAHVKQREPVTELSDKRLKKYVKKATKSADVLQYYSDSRTDPDWEKAQKRKKMVDVAKKKLGESAPPGMEDTVLKLKKQYPGDESKAFAIAWSIYNKKKGKKPVDEAGFPHDVDHMPGPTVKKQSKGCTTCHGRKAVYSLNGKLRADNPGQGAKRIACPTCKGTGDLIESVSKEQELINSVAERLAAKYRANEYEEFELDMLSTLPKHLLPLANLPELFDLYNPHRQREGGEIWARMLKHPEKYINSK